MQCTTSRFAGLYLFRLMNGKTLRTRFSPREISCRYLFMALDERGNVRVVLSEEVDFKTFEYVRLR